MRVSPPNCLQLLHTVWNDREILFTLSRGGNEVLENSVYEQKKKTKKI